MNPAAAYSTSFKELDRLWAAPKGTAFRAFKRALPSLTEDRDFVRLDGMRDHIEIETLRAAGRIYPSSVHVVLLSATGVTRLRRP
ncbi:MAG: hypothetical protein WCC11_11120 [Gammaproteobacteria bacterium]